jgi:hypothetical protein
MRIYEINREKRINEIAELLKKFKEDGEVYDKKKVLNIIQFKYLVSQRTATEYLGVAILKNEFV